MFDIKTTAKIPKTLIRPEMLVRPSDEIAKNNPKTAGSIGLVVQLTRHWVHVLWLVNTNPGNAYDYGTDFGLGNSRSADKFWETRGKHHFVTLEKRQHLTPLPAGTVVTITQTEK